jgi:LuxR family transcriptional activator of conjugal transfer of Ti plasmids
MVSRLLSGIEPMPVKNDTYFRHLKAGEKDYKRSDSGGLFMLVTKTGSKLWRYGYSGGTLGNRVLVSNNHGSRKHLYRFPRKQDGTVMKGCTPLGRIDQFVGEINKAKDKRCIEQALYKHISLLGFERFAYQVFRSHQGPRPPTCLTNYPREWDLRYEEQNYVNHDLVGRHAMRVARPFSWSEIGRYDDFTRRQRAIFDEATEFGIRSGGSIGISGPGLIKAQFTVTSSVSKAEFAKLFAARRHEVLLVATYVHERLFQLGFLDAAPLNLHLSPHELDILTWTAEGKTRGEISEIMAVSEETIKTHFSSIFRKLGVRNKTHAAAVALMNGLIFP